MNEAEFYVSDLRVNSAQRPRVGGTPSGTCRRLFVN